MICPAWDVKAYRLQRKHIWCNMPGMFTTNIVILSVSLQIRETHGEDILKGKRNAPTSR